MATILLLAFLASPGMPTIAEDVIEKAVTPHKGSVVVLNLWATWCGPCREEFPDLVRLHNEKKAVVVSISMDEPEDGDQVREYLASQNATFPSFLRAFEDFRIFAEAVDPDWSGAIPATFVFDKSGRRVYGHEGKLTYEELSRIVEEYR
jgi:thiol-disulfide isomerase/thioredoxin